MLSLPKRLLYGYHPSIDFKLSQLDGIARLYSERHIPYHDSKYWSRFLQLETAADVFSVLSLADLRRTRRDAPENVVTLVRVMVAHLESLLADPLFEPPPSAGTAGGSNQDGFSSRLNNLADISKWKVPGASLMGFDSNSNTVGSYQRNRTREALNVIRILTRTLPAVMESDDTEFEHQVLWTQTPDAYADPEPSQGSTAHAAKTSDDATTSATGDKLDTSAQFVIDDDEDDEAVPSSKAEVTDHPLSSSNTAADNKAESQHDDEPIPEALGERLVRLVVDLLFCSGFSLPWTEDEIEEATPGTPLKRINYSIWEAGVGSSVDLPGTTRFHVSNRVEVLRLLLVVLSKSIYIPASQQNTQVDPALKFAIQDLDRSVMLPLLCSLINTSITNARNSTAAWFGLPSVGGLVSGSNDEVRTNLVTLSLQILDVLLTYDAPVRGETDTVSLSTIGRPLPGPGGQNVFRFYLSKLHRTADFDFMWTGLAKSFNEHINSTIQILAIPIPTGGGGRRAAETSWQLSQVAERLVLLWRLLEHNHKFRLFVLDDAKRAPELLGILLYFSLTYKDNLAMQGLVRLCAFMLQDVSSERVFATNLAKPGSAAKVQLPSRLGLMAGNTAIDFLVQGVYLLIATTKGQLSSLHAPLVISLSNTAPAWRSISITASTKVIHLLRSFSQPAFLLSEEGNPRLLFYVLETINAVLTSGFRENVNLVYSLVLARGLVEALEKFELRRAVQDVWMRRTRAGMDTRDWFEGRERLEKVPLPGAEPSASTQGSQDAVAPVNKGKMRHISDSSTDLPAAAATETKDNAEYSGELVGYPLHVVESVAAEYIGKNGFAPTQDWVASWHIGLPLSTPRLVIDRLLPEIERIAAGGSTTSGNVEITGGDADARVLAFLREQPMSEYLPPPEGGFHARGWTWTEQGMVWLRSYLWGVVYVEGLLPWGLWSDTQVRLFRVVGGGERRASGSERGAAREEGGDASRRTSVTGSDGQASTPTGTM